MSSKQRLQCATAKGELSKNVSILITIINADRVISNLILA